MIPHISIIANILFSETSCEENESERKEVEKEIIESEYPLLGLVIGSTNAIFLPIERFRLSL